MDLFDKALDHVRRAQSPAVLARQRQDGGRVLDTAFEHLQRVWSFFLKLIIRCTEGRSGLFRALRFQDPVQPLVHLVVAGPWRLIDHVPPEVRLTTLPAPREALGNGFFEPLVRIGGHKLNPGEATLFEIGRFQAAPVSPKVTSRPRISR